MSDAGHTMLVASAIVSIAINPMIFRALPRIEAWLRARPKLWTMLNGRAERKARKTNLAAAAALGAPTAGERIAVVVGFGPWGARCTACCGTRA
ncbi:MAG: hypothetical protein IPN17_30510 [Deltaproteobacteria bacterium]|nr:hypothetical protein [Deltaproteobacteria bacterium]